MDSPQTPADPFHQMPTAVVHDILADTASRLTALYVNRSDTAATEQEREEWWSKVMELRNAKRAVPARDREQLIEHIALWSAQYEILKDPDHG